jgi:hypothetical protein
MLAKGGRVLPNGPEIGPRDLDWDLDSPPIGAPATRIAGEASDGSAASTLATHRPGEPLLLTGPTQGKQNAIRGNAFERAALNALYAEKNAASFTAIDGRVTTVPDLPLNDRFGVTDVKDEVKLSFDKQLKAQYAAATTARVPFNLIVSPRTERISMPLQRAVARTDGHIFEFDAATGRFSAVVTERNRIVRNLPVE